MKNLMLALSLLVSVQVFAGDNEINFIEADQLTMDQVDADSVDVDSVDANFLRRPREYFVCKAINRRRMVFTARGFNPREVESQAMRECRRVSRECRPLGCERRF